MTEYRFEPGATFPSHRHAQEQITIVAEGQVAMTIDGRWRRSARAAGRWSAPKSTTGSRRAREGARFLAVVTPRRGAADEYEVE